SQHPVNSQFPTPNSQVALPGSWELAVGSYLCSLPNALISTSTPAGRSSFISASTVCGVGSKISISRLCVRRSYCSRSFLTTCGKLPPAHLFFPVGSGTGPASRAPVRRAVSTISVVDWSRTRLSYAFRRIRILSLNGEAICLVPCQFPTTNSQLPSFSPATQQLGLGVGSWTV